MEAENLNIFGKNQEEIGSLDKNLVLRTKGRVYIRYGKKYIELLDDKGNLNVKIPKVLLRVNSADNIKTNGFYLIEGELYAYYEGDLYLITGQEGKYIQYEGNLDLTLEQINTSLKNIGLKFDNIKEAKKHITNGIVFVNDRIYYIDGNDIIDLLLTLNLPLNAINDSELGEAKTNNTAIIYKNNRWSYELIPTILDIEDLKLKINNSNNNEEKGESFFDPIQYSKVYTISELTFNIDDDKLSAISIITSPVCLMENGDIGIISIYGVESEIKTEDSDQYLYPKYSIKEEYIDSEEVEEKYYLNLEILTFNFIYEDGEFFFLKKDSIGNWEKYSYLLNMLPFEDPQGDEVYYIQFDGKNYAFPKGFEESFSGKHLYIKAEEENHYKFKIDYEHAEIALEENNPKNIDGKLEIIPHTVLGDLDDKSEYYNSPAKSFRTYKEKENSLGLFSDLAVFVGTEFRLPLDYKEPEIPEESEETEIEYSDTEVYNFPRYSKILNEILCTKHKLEDLEENDVFREVIPSIEYLTKFEEYINLKFEEIILEINDSVSSSMPIGAIIMWSGSSDSLPEGWNICDGGTYDGITTPDLRNKFIIGAGDKYSIGSSGGNKEITLTTSQLPSHSHEFYDYLTLVHGDGEIHTGTATINGESMTIGKHSTTKNPTRRAQTDDSGHSDMPYLKHKTSSEGSDSPIDITPPYYALSYIMKTKETVIKDSNGEETEESEDTNNQ